MTAATPSAPMNLEEATTEVLDDAPMRGLQEIADRLVGGLDEVMTTTPSHLPGADALRLATACARALADQLAEIVRSGGATTVTRVRRITA